MITEQHHSISPICPACGSGNARYVAKKNKWSCQDPDCAELFVADPPAREGEASPFIKQKIFLSYAHKVDDNDDFTADLVGEIKVRLERAGHDAWIDVHQLHPGKEWRLGITDGIMTSDRVLSFLSPRSVREPGVCLDEIGISMSHKFGAIATLLADIRVVGGIPASVSYVQYLDLSKWQTIKAQGEPAWTQWLEKNVAIILNIIAQNTGFAGEIEALSKLLSPLPQSAKIGNLIEKGLVGRQWIKDAISQWRLGKKDQRMFWLMAGPGMGKSAIAAHLAHYSKLQVVAHHFCDYNVPESRSAARFVQNLAFMLAARLPDYRYLLQTQLGMLTKPLAQYTADEMILRLVIEPLRSKIDGGQVDDRLLVVIDALDEALPELPDLLNRHLSSMPSWLGFVATSRPDVKEALAGFPAFELRIDDSQNLSDLQAYLQDWQVREPEAPLGDLAQEKLIEASDGSILYLVMARQGYKSGLFDLADLTRLPMGITGIYRIWMQRQFGAVPEDSPSWTSFCYPLLELLCATPMPVPQGTAAGLLGWKGQDRRRALSPLGSLITLEAGNLRLCHRSFGEWLEDESTTNNPFWVNARDAKLNLAQGLLKALSVGQGVKEPGYLHLALPSLLQELDAEQCRQLLQPDWDAAIDHLDKLADFLHPFHGRDVYERRLSLQRWLVKIYLGKFGLEHRATLMSMCKLTAIVYAQGDRLNAKLLLEQTVGFQIKTLGEEHPDVLLSMNNLAGMLGMQGDLAGARAIQEELFALHIKTMGEEHPTTLVAMTNLAQTIGQQGDLASARALQEQGLALMRQTLGVANPVTMSRMNNLSTILFMQGDVVGARALQEQTLTLQRKTLGEGHPDTLVSKVNLAQTLQAQGDLAGARELQEQALTLQRKTLGEGHPDTLSTMANLAKTLQAQGDLAGARALQEQVLTLQRKALGEDHRDTLVSMFNLAQTLRAQGDLAGAKALGQQVAALLTQTLGNEHPDTLASKVNLAQTLQAQGDLAGAGGLLEHVLILQRKTLGEGHPDTLATMTNLALTLRTQGDLASAKALGRKVAALLTQTLGDAHPDTLVSKVNLAQTLQAQGNLAGAGGLLEHVLILQRKTLGNDHPDTLISMNNLAGVLFEQGDLAGAKALGVQVLELTSHTLGEGHPDTSASMTNLAQTLQAQGDLAGARELQEKALALMSQTLGPEHPDTMRSINNLAVTLFSLGDLAGARALQEQVLAIQRKILGGAHPETLTKSKGDP